MMAHRWAAITVAGEPLEVSADAVTVDGQRVTATYAEALEWADALGAELPTPAVLDARWQQADLQNLPHTQPLHRGSNDPILHNVAIDRDIAEHRERCGEDPRIVGNVGKHWVASRSGGYPLYGWHVPAGELSWRGIKTHPADSGETAARVLQPYSPNAHGADHKDYSMTVVLCRRPKASQPPDTIPSPREPWQDPGLSRGERALAWSQAEKADGVCERTHLFRIQQYLDGCERWDAKLGRHVKLGLKCSRRKVWNWCAASACFADRESLLPGEEPFLPWVCSGLELERWAMAHGVWHPAHEVRSRDYEPNPGDVVILGRGAAGSWERHVCRWVERRDHAYLALGGNEHDEWRLTQRAVDAVNLQGVIAYPDVEPSFDLQGSLFEASRRILRDGDDPMAVVQRLIDQGVELT